MKPPLLYLSGPPGAGKTTLAAELRAGFDVVQRDSIVPHLLLIDPATGNVAGAELGRLRDTFSGTDALHMGINPHACRFVRNPHPFGFLLGEGMRLANKRFLEAARNRYTVHLVCLAANDWLCDQRCAQRGSTQDARWRKAGATRAANLREWALAQDWITVYDIDAAAPATLSADLLRGVALNQEEVTA